MFHLVYVLQYLTRQGLTADALNLVDSGLCSCQGYDWVYCHIELISMYNPAAARTIGSMSVVPATILLPVATGR